MVDEYTSVREYLVDELRKDLVGPSSPNEELTDRPTIHYQTGILYPMDSTFSSEEDGDGQEASDRDDDIDIGTLMAMASNPSSIGLTFRVKKGQELLIEAKAANYHQDDGEKIWKRQPLSFNLQNIKILNAGIEKKKIHSGLDLLIRRRRRNDDFVVTISMINTNPGSGTVANRDELCFFQPEIRVSSPDGKGSVFIAGGDLDAPADNSERASMDLLYRNRREFGAGHGCAVDWDDKNFNDPIWISTSILPAYEVENFTPDFKESFQAQEMLFLARSTGEDLIRELREFNQSYLDWINTKNKEILKLPDSMKKVAEEHIAECRTAWKRIEKGIDTLTQNSDAFEAFQLANEAMLIQRSRISWFKKKRENSEGPIVDSSHQWRPFQLAFILLSLTSIVDPADEYRRHVDLLWFPTGGGKTEAYLGLIAFTIFFRRIQNKGQRISAGITALMRYTLRLLTIQQFQRAATLILACDSIRRKNPKRFGTSDIGIGLWVGGGATPNTITEAEKNLKKLKKGEDLFEGNPVQLHQCPWCGEELDVYNYRISDGMQIECSNELCEYKSGLPVYLIDDDIYRRKPSLLIGTVDKFARLPWIAAPSDLFGRGKETHLPPDLIIQDELHLISGPLGSLVGLYEVAIDRLSSRDEVSPKIIASTATIRKANAQIKRLFNRTLFQFPPSGLEAEYSWFARQQRITETPGRLFLGIHAPGKSMKTTLLRVYALLLQKIYEHEGETKYRDPYWTLVGYFNSLRELGGTIRLVNDDIPDRVKVLAGREPGGRTRQHPFRYTELNSRITSKELPVILRNLENTIDRDPYDILLATNMISVGVDIDRLGMMVVTGQPKMTSEYIQATSRVGRKYPGLVITVYNWTRPRDRSHYERFRSYHQAIYSQVEAMSVTPFSARALDRGLHGVFISLVRHLLSDLRSDQDADRFDPALPEVLKIKNYILGRIQNVDPDGVDWAKDQLDKIIERWMELKALGKLKYATPYHPDKSGADQTDIQTYLMISAEIPDQVEDFQTFPTLNSLRDVESEAGLFFIDQGARQ